MRTCAQCGAQLPEDAHPNTKLCSDACRRARHRAQDAAHQRRKRGEIPCAQCGRPLPPRHTRFCSDACHRASVNERRRLPRRTTCEQCGGPMPADAHYQSKYCGQACSWAAQLASNRRCRAAHREQYTAQQRAHYAANREAQLARSRRYREANREKTRESSRRYREANPEKVAEQRRRYLEKNADREAERARRYREANRERRKARHQQWIREHPERNRAYASRRRAREVAADAIPYTPEALAARLAPFAGCCWVCGAPAEHVDHIVPLRPRKGDTQGADRLENLAPLCASDNTSKHNRPVHKWLPRRLAALLGITTKQARSELDELVTAATGRPASEVWDLFKAEQPDYAAITEAIRMLAAVLGTYEEEQEDAA